MVISMSLNQEQVDRLVELLDKRDDLNFEIRSMLAGTLFTTPKPKKTDLVDTFLKKPKPETKAAMEVDVNIWGVEWKLSNRQGGGRASPEAGWAWGFGYDQDGVFLPEAERLIELIQRYGKIRVGQYEITLGGRDKRLLNRKKI